MMRKFTTVAFHATEICTYLQQYYVIKVIVDNYIFRNWYYFIIYIYGGKQIKKVINNFMGGVDIVNKFVNYSHRGVSSYVPENTMSAFEKTIELS